MLDKLRTFCSNSLTKIQRLVDAQYALCKQIDILDYFGKLLENNKFFYNNIENVNNKRYYQKNFAYMLINYMQI